MGEGKHLYFIAIIPPSAICDSINVIKNDFALRFQSKHALKVVPHVTLKSPFRFAALSHTRVLQWFEQLKISVRPFQQELKDYGCFMNNRSPVIFIKPMISDSLVNLQKQVFEHFHESFPEFTVTNAEVHYKPHLTVAYRDLLPEQFQRAWQEYSSKEFNTVFAINSFHLLMRNRKQWNSISEFILK